MPGNRVFLLDFSQETVQIGRSMPARQGQERRNAPRKERRPLLTPGASPGGAPARGMSHEP